MCESVCAACYHLDIIRASQNEDFFGVAVRQHSELCGLPHVLDLHGSLRGQRCKFMYCIKSGGQLQNRAAMIGGGTS